ncbi:MAG: sigma 54-interacting transcriptional regulator [Syntrophaceae bacterium]|nr:sigma 54-interacting transcriptional regulator [Syntrophaceae bacterium]
MSRIKTVIDEIAKTDITVLIKGETGTGKELLAQVIHSHSPRKDKPFVKVNCAAIPKGLLESELFGFEKGAFTGAYIKKPGKFELANHGTILLNDIGEIDISVQAKLLDILQDGVFSRLGGDGEVMVNTRVITTTKDHLEKSVMEGQFREDLFFRVNVMNITLPPLRERKDQILPLSQYYFDFYKEKFGKAIPPFSSKAIHTFQEYPWPGNIRELENMIKRIVLFGEEDLILEDLMSRSKDNGKSPEGLKNGSSNPMKGEEYFNLKDAGKRAAEEAEKEIILNILQETHWNRKKAAQLLHVSYKALLNKIQKYHLDGTKDDVEWKRN